MTRDLGFQSPHRDASLFNDCMRNGHNPARDVAEHPRSTCQRLAVADPDCSRQTLGNMSHSSLTSNALSYPSPFFAVPHTVSPPHLQYNNFNSTILPPLNLRYPQYLSYLPS